MCEYGLWTRNQASFKARVLFSVATSARMRATGVGLSTVALVKSVVNVDMWMIGQAVVNAVKLEGSRANMVGKVVFVGPC